MFIQLLSFDQPDVNKKGRSLQRYRDIQRLHTFVRSLEHLFNRIDLPNVTQTTLNGSQVAAIEG